jgi:8-oxo-dGTP diphosphatase
MTPQSKKPRHGAVAVVVESGKFLVIRRSLTVRAPGLLCFPGGSIEQGETPQQAVRRELREELALNSISATHLWHSCTSWGTLLEWLWVERHAESFPVANPREVADIAWYEPDHLLEQPDLLGSVPDFFAAWAIGHFHLPSTAGLPNSQWKALARK